MPAVASRKRKQMEGMEESPPKRVTRARTAKSTVPTIDKATTTSSKSQVKDTVKDTRSATTKSIHSSSTTKITTASVKAVAAAAAKGPPKKAISSRIVARRGVDQQSYEESADELERMEQPALAKKPRGRPRKVPEPSKEPPPSRESVKKSAVAINKAAIAEQPRQGRVSARKATKSVDTETQDHNSKEREPATGTKAPVQKPEAVKKSTTKKRVVFDDMAVLDKENVPLKRNTKSKATASGTSKVQSISDSANKTSTSSKASVKSSTSKSGRCQKATSKASGQSPSPRPSTPLSPKKVSQVAKSVSSGSEDELCEKSPSRALSKSPRKAPSTVHNFIKVAHAAEQPSASSESPLKVSQTAGLQSPAKRPPPSPFKDSIKQSPTKFNLSHPSTSDPATSGSNQHLHQTLLSSPRKINLLPSTISGNVSPKKPAPNHPLFMSPPKRPVSPVKHQAVRSPAKCKSPSQGQDGREMPTITPRRLFIRSPLESSSNDELGAQIGMHTQLSLKTSPAKVAFVQYNTNPLDAYRSQLVQQGKVDQPTASPYRSKQVHYDSDDETMLSASKMDRAVTSNLTSETPDAKTYRRQTLGITPLALKMSSWDPNTSTSEIYEETLTPEQPGSLSQAQHEPLRYPLVTKPSETSENSSSFFEDEINNVLVKSSVPAFESPAPVGACKPTDEVGDIVTMAADMNDNEANPLLNASIDGFEPTPYSQELEARMECSERNGGPTSISYTSRGSSTDGHNSPMVDDNLPDTSQGSDLYGDENSIPIDPMLLHGSDCMASPTGIGVNINLETPSPNYRPRQREIHTVSKVPLRMEGPDDSPIKIPRKRAKSIGAPLGDITGLKSDEQSNEHTAVDKFRKLHHDLESSPRKISYETSIINALMTPSKECSVSPVKSLRTGPDAQILRGAVVHVDVHTSEGADASSIFIELLTQMGARCVKQWTWNPRYSSAQNQTPGRNDDTSSSKVGITHVVFKDGGKRTLQKVREAKGLVLCVGVSWVLDCERENVWLDEAPYAVDVSTIPRGGHNRRKSMEPKMVLNQGGTLVSTNTPKKGAYEVTSPTAEFRAFGAASRRSSIRASPLIEFDDEMNQDPQPPTTPVPSNTRAMEVSNFDAWAGDGVVSPTTPYYLDRGAELLQQTCPPKQYGERLFPVSGQIEDQPDETVRQRLIAARRKSLQWAPKIKSPLGRSVSYGKH